MNNKGLCFRCEYRARFQEIGNAPRYECSSLGLSVNGCYMYKPVRPVILERCSYEKELAKKTDTIRPMGGPNMIAARCDRYEKEPDMILSYHQIDEDHLLLYWSPKGEINNLLKALKGE